MSIQNERGSPLRSGKKETSKVNKETSLGGIEQPEKVRVLILTQQKIIFQEYYYLKGFTQIIKLDLSYNKISQFPPGFSFKQFMKLKTLFLHYNKFDKLKNLEVLTECKELIYLTLFGNPLQQTRARHFCLNIVPSLKLMDDKPVKQEQKYQGVLHFKLNPQNDRVGFPLIQISENQTSIQFLASVYREIKMAKQFYAKVNPIVLIQKWWKKLIKTKNHSQQPIPQNQIQKSNYDQNSLSKLQKDKIILTNQLESFQSDSILNQKPNNQILQHQVQNSRNQQETQFQLLKKLKVIQFIESAHFGLKSFEPLLSEDNSLLCPKDYCLENEIHFKESSKFNEKHLNFFRTPFSSPQYDLSKQKSKQYLSLVFHNNFHYLLQLKSKNPYTSLKTQPLKEQQKNFQNHEIVEVDSSTSEKIKYLRSAYFKCKSRSYNQPFPFLFGINIIKISAAIKIQKIWRGHKARLNCNALQKAKQSIAARKIQKWVRSLQFRHRKNFLIETFLFLKKNDFPNILMKLESFCSLHQIYEKLLLKGEFLKLPFQCSDVQIFENLNEKLELSDDTDGQLNLRSKKAKTEITFHAQRQPFPCYFNKYIKPFKLGGKKQYEDDIDIKKFKIIDLLIKGAIQVKKFQAFANVTDRYKSSFVKFEYSNRQDANQRKLMLCLLTYSFKKKGWVSFQSEKDSDSHPNQMDVNDQIRNTHFLKMIYDNDKKDKLFSKIEKYTKEIKKTSDVHWMPLKIRYFEGTNDYSSIMIVGIYKNGELETDKSKQGSEREAFELGASRRRLNELNSLKTLQNKMALNKLDTHMLTPQNMKRQMDTNLISFSIQLDNPIEMENSLLSDSNNQQRQNFLNFLRSDNSLMSLLDQSPLNTSINSQGSSLPLKNKQRNSSINQNISQKDHSVADLSLQDKKLFIEKLKNSHKQNIQLLAQMKKRKTEIIKSQYKSIAEQNKKLIRQSSNSSLLQNINKAQLIKQYEKHRASTKHELQNFQSRFLRKGNFSIQHDLKEFQKNRSRSNNKKYDTNKPALGDQSIPPIKKSARYQNSNIIQTQSKAIQNKMGQARQYLNIKKQNLKTELKEFSIQLSEGFDVSSSVYPESEMHMQHSESINLLLLEHKKSKEMRSRNKRDAMSSATSEKYSKLYEQKRREFLKSEEKEKDESGLLSSVRGSERANVVINSKSGENLKEIKEKNRGQEKQKEGTFRKDGQKGDGGDDKKGDEKGDKRKLKKKKLVHSVFPEEFYPLQDSQQIGFHLPKIKSANSPSSSNHYN